MTEETVQEIIANLDKVLTPYELPDCTCFDEGTCKNCPYHHVVENDQE